jgi:drug/metabolite transporter (DMT)-like permease
MVIGGLGQAIITYLSLRALDYLPVGPLAFLFYTYPAWVVLISAVRGTGEITIPRLLALALAMIGIAIMVGMPSANTLNPTGVALALGTALIYALYLPALHKVQTGIPPMSSAFYLVTGVFVSFMAASLFLGTMQIPASLSIWGFLFVLSLVSTVIAFASLIAGLHTLGPVRTSIVATIEPFFTAVLGIIVLGESLALPTIVGGALIAGAVVLLQLTDAVRTPLEPVI